MKYKCIFAYLLLIAVMFSNTAFADERTPMKLWELEVEQSFWREHPEIAYENVWYDPWGNMLAGISETGADVIALRLYNEEIQPFIDAEIMADLSSSPAIADAVSRMPPWIQRLVTTEDGQIFALPTAAIPRPFYWYQDAWDAAGLTAEDVPESYTELLDFLDAWAKRVEEKPEKNICVSRLVRWNTGTEKFNYMYWLMETLIMSHEMQQRHAGIPVAFNTPEFIALAERTRQTGLALYEAELRQTKRDDMLQLFQNDIRGGEHANNGHSYGMSHTVPLRLAGDQPELARLTVEVVFVRRDSLWLDEGILLLEHLLGSSFWPFEYALYTDFEAGDYPYEGGGTGHVDGG